MADIQMCRDSLCPMKSTCYRYRAKPNDDYQYYFMISPRNDNGTCDAYWGDSKQILSEQLKDIIKDADKNKNRS